MISHENIDFVAPSKHCSFRARWQQSSVILGKMMTHTQKRHFPEEEYRKWKSDQKMERWCPARESNGTFHWGNSFSAQRRRFNTNVDKCNNGTNPLCGTMICKDCTDSFCTYSWTNVLAFICYKCDTGSGQKIRECNNYVNICVTSG